MFIAELAWNINDFGRILHLQQLLLNVKLEAWRLSDFKSVPIDHFSVCGAVVVDVGLVVGSTKLTNST